MLKPGDKVKFVKIKELKKEFIKLLGQEPNESDKKTQERLQGNIVTVSFSQENSLFFQDEEDRTFFIGRVKKLSNLELNNDLFEL